MKEEKFKTLHPIPGKTNKSISKSKYDLVRINLLAILNESQLSHTDLMEALYNRIKDNFEGGIQ
jgi:hypothetical protein